MSQPHHPIESLLLEGLHLEKLTLCRGFHLYTSPLGCMRIFFRAVCANSAPGHEFPLIKMREHLKIKQDGLSTQHFLFLCGEEWRRASFSTLVVSLCNRSKGLALISRCKGEDCVTMIATWEMVFSPWKHDLLECFLKTWPHSSPSPDCSCSIRIQPCYYCLINAFWTLERQVIADR